MDTAREVHAMLEGTKGFTQEASAMADVSVDGCPKEVIEVQLQGASEVMLTDSVRGFVTEIGPWLNEMMDAKLEEYRASCEGEADASMGEEGKKEEARGLDPDPLFPPLEALSLPSATVELREAERGIQELMQERDGFALERMEARAQAWALRRAAAPAVQARCNGRAMADHDGDHAGLQSSPKIVAEGLTKEALVQRASSSSTRGCARC